MYILCVTWFILISETEQVLSEKAYIIKIEKVSKIIDSFFRLLATKVKLSSNVENTEK